MDLEAIKAQYPADQVNALGKRDMDNIRALIAECESLSYKLSSLRITAGSGPCKRLLLQQQPLTECFPFYNCAGCDCWRAGSAPEAPK